MQGGRSKRPLAIGLVLAVIAAGVVLAVLLSGGDDGHENAATAPTATETVTTEKTVTEQTETTTTGTRRNEQEVEQTVTTFVESSEQRDSQQACSLVAGGGGKQLPDCAAAAGINLSQLPSSDELQVDDVNVSGNQAKAKLSNGSTFSLEQSGGQWKITGFRPRETGSRGGGRQRSH